MVRTLEDITLVPAPTANRLDATARTRYEQYRRRFRDWLATVGKNPGRAEGYALSAVKTRMARTDKFLRWLWTTETDGFTLQLTPAHADAYMQALAQEDYKRSYKADLQKAVKCLCRFAEIDWEPRETEVIEQRLRVKRRRREIRRELEEVRHELADAEFSAEVLDGLQEHIVG